MGGGGGILHILRVLVDPCVFVRFSALPRWKLSLHFVQTQSEGIQ